VLIDPLAQLIRKSLASGNKRASYVAPVFNKGHLSYDACLEVRREIIRTVLCCVLKLCTVISTLRWAVFTVLWIGFVTLGLFRRAKIYFCLFVCILCVFVSYCI